MAKTKFGTFDDLLEIAEDTQKPTLTSLRNLILGIHSDAYEVVRLGDRAATYGIGPKKNSEGYAYITPHKSWVNLGFFYGVELPDPDGLLEGGGKKMRHIKIQSLQDAANPAVRKLIEAALAERKNSLSIE